MFIHAAPASEKVSTLLVKSRQKVHTSLKVSVFLNVLPEKYRKQIHRSQQSRYRKMNPSEYLGHELATELSREIDFIRQLGDYPKAKVISKCILKLFVFFRSVFKNTKGFYKKLKEEKDFFVELSQRFRSVLSARQFSKLIGLDENTFRNWIREVRVRCSDSLINSCRKVHINQLLPSETTKMKKLLADERFQYWPLISIYYYALRNNICAMALSTWYKYVPLLEIKRLKPRSVKSYGISVRAEYPNQYWHADVTKFRTMDGVWNYIYSVVDNFSKFPLSVVVSDKLCGKTRVETFREALKTAVTLCPDVKTINLVVDGGCENFNGSVDDFLENINKIKIHRIRALRDVAWSNSAAEAFFRILKTYYLNQRTIANVHELCLRVEEDVTDFAYERPHGKLNGLTPFEALIGNIPDKSDFKEQITKAKAMRIVFNRGYGCSKCNFK